MKLASKPVVRRAKGKQPMLTPNDRISQTESGLNQFKAESRKVYGDLTQKLKMAEVASETLIKQVGSLEALVKYHFDKIEMHREAQEAHLMYLHEKADKTDKRLDRMEATLGCAL
jgi:hypothetical protein